MRKVLLSLALAIGVVSTSEAAPKLIPFTDNIEPTKTSITVFSSTGAFVTIAAPPSRVRNCLTHLVVSPQRTSFPANYTINILDAGTTTYTVNMTTGTSHVIVWPETNPWCGGPKKATYITGNSLAPIATGLALDVSYQGFTQ